MTNLPFVFSKYIQFFNILTRFLQSKFTRQGEKKLTIAKDYWSVCCELHLATALWVIVFMRSCLAVPNPGLLGMKWLKVPLLTLNGMQITPLPPSPPRFCRVSLTFYRYPFKLLGGERHALWKLSVFPNDTSRCKLLDPESNPLIGPMQCVFRSAVRNRLFSKNNLII